MVIFYFGDKALLKLLHTSLVKSLRILCCIGKMLFVCLGEIMSTREILLSTHIEIIVMHEIEHSINTCYAWNTDRTRRKSLITICVIRTLNAQELGVDTTKLKLLKSELDSRICL